MTERLDIFAVGLPQEDIDEMAVLEANAALIPDFEAQAHEAEMNSWGAIVGGNE